MSWSAGVLKPDPLIYRAALDALGLIPGEAAYVGDGGDGELRGARRLGLRTVLIERGLPHTESARADPDVCCADLAEAGRAGRGNQPCDRHSVPLLHIRLAQQRARDDVARRARPLLDRDLLRRQQDADIGAAAKMVVGGIWILPVALSIDNLTYGAVTGVPAHASVWASAGLQALASGALGLIGLAIGIGLGVLIPALRTRMYRTFGIVGVGVIATAAVLAFTGW